MPINKHVNPIWKVIFVLLVVYFSINLISQEQLIERKDSEYAEVQAQIAAEEKRSDDLLREKDMLMSDESVERIARERLGMVMPGERVYVDLNRQQNGG